MDEYVWNDKYSTGHAAIDAQHKQIFSMLQQFQEAFKGRMDSALVFGKIKELQVYVVDHFALEEKEMAPFKETLSLYSEHIQHHALLIQTVGVFMDRFEREGVGIAKEMYKVLGMWLDTHIKDMDIKTFEALKDLKGQ